MTDFRRLADALPLFVWTESRSGEIEWANRTWYDYVRLPPKIAVTKEGWARVVHPDDLPSVLEIRTAAIARGTPFEIEHRLRPADEQAYRWFLARVAPRRDRRGRVYGWLGTGIDIHDAKVRAEEMARLSAIAAANQRRAAAIADAVPQIFWTASADGWIDWYNRGWYDYTGQTPEEAAGWGWQAVHHPEDFPEVMRRWSHSIATGEPFEMHFRLRGKDGVFRWFLTRGVPERDADGRVVKWYGTNTNVDAERRASTQMAFFARLGEVLAGTLDIEETLSALTRLLVPEFADWALVNVVDERSGELTLAATHHRDPQRHELAQRLLGERYIARTGAAGSALVASTGRPTVYPTVPSEVFAAVLPEHRPTIAAIGVESSVIVPIVHRGRVRATVNVIASTSGRRYIEEDIPFFAEIARRVAPAIASAEAYERERRVARSFQEAALPQRLPRIPGMTFDALYEAGRTEALLGGDFYDALRLPDGRVVLAIGDVAGSGVEAAATMAQVRQSLRAVAGVNPDPLLMLQGADRVLHERESARFVTAWVGIVDPIDFSLTFASAGHPAPLLRGSDGAIAPLPAGDLPLGLRSAAGESSVAETIAVAPGSVLVLYTDGLTEATRDVLTGENRLRAALAVDEAWTAPDGAGPDGPGPAHRLRDRVLGAGEGAHDDVALLVVGFDRTLVEAAGPTRPSRWRFAADDAEAASAARRAMAGWLAACGLPPDELFTAELIFSELVGNVLRYAPGEVQVVLDVSGAAPVLHVLDAGTGFEHNPKLPVDALSESGRGLYIVARMARDFSVSRRPDAMGGGSHARAVLPGELRGGCAPTEDRASDVDPTAASISQAPTPSPPVSVPR